jgi:hypothetical protein
MLHDQTKKQHLLLCELHRRALRPDHKHNGATTGATHGVATSTYVGQDIGKGQLLLQGPVQLTCNCRYTLAFLGTRKQ